MFIKNVSHFRHYVIMNPKILVDVKNISLDNGLVFEHEGEKVTKEYIRNISQRKNVEKSKFYNIYLAF